VIIVAYKSQLSFHWKYSPSSHSHTDSAASQLSLADYVDVT